MRDVYDSISNGGEGGEHSQLHTKQRVGGGGGGGGGEKLRNWLVKLSSNSKTIVACEGRRKS